MYLVTYKESYRDYDSRDGYETVEYDTYKIMKSEAEVLAWADSRTDWTKFQIYELGKEVRVEKTLRLV